MAIYKDVSSLEVVGYTEPKNGTFSDGVEFILEKLDAIPEADVESVRHGYWIPHKTMIRSPFAKNYNCSECGRENFEYPNCPYCRAKMDGKENE